MSIIVTGASGQYGRLAVKGLLKRVPAGELVLTTRNPDATEFAALGAQVRYADFDEAETLPDAFAGGERMLLISTLSVGRRVPQHTRAIEAAAAAGVKQIVYTSFVGIQPDNHAMVTAEHGATEELLRKSGVAYTFLRDSQYAEAVSDVIAPMVLATGKWRAAAGEGKIALVSRDDCAESAVAVLTTPGHENKIYDITGPELLSYREAAALVAEVAGKPVEYEVISDDELYAQFDAIGVPRQVDDNAETDIPWCSDDMVSFERAIREGALAMISDHVRELTGHPPRSLRDLLLAKGDLTAPPPGAG